MMSQWVKDVICLVIVGASIYKALTTKKDAKDSKSKQTKLSVGVKQNGC